jgi:hypothetical protein
LIWVQEAVSIPPAKFRVYFVRQRGFAAIVDIGKE